MEILESKPLMIPRRANFELELDAPRAAVLAYVQMAAVMAEVEFEGLDPLELRAVTGLVSGVGFVEHSPEEALRYDIHCSEERQGLGESVDERHLALKAVVKEALKLRRIDEPDPTPTEPPILLPEDLEVQMALSNGREVIAGHFLG